MPVEEVGFARENHHLNFGARVTSFVVLLFAEVLHADAAGHVHAVKQEVFPWLVLAQGRDWRLVKQALAEIIGLYLFVLCSDGLVPVVHVAELVKRAKGDDVKVGLQLCRVLSRLWFVLQVAVEDRDPADAQEDND